MYSKTRTKTLSVEFHHCEGLSLGMYVFCVCCRHSNTLCNEKNAATRGQQRRTGRARVSPDLECEHVKCGDAPSNAQLQQCPVSTASELLGHVALCEGISLQVCHAEAIHPLLGSFHVPARAKPHRPTLPGGSSLHGAGVTTEDISLTKSEGQEHEAVLFAPPRLPGRVTTTQLYHKLQHHLSKSRNV